MIRTVRLAFDVTPLLGPRTGIGTFTAEILGRLATRDDVEVVAHCLSWRGRGEIPSLVPPGVRLVTRPAPARPLRQLWRRFDLPTLEWWTGPIDVAHSPNYVVAPTRHAAQLASVHDLTCIRFPDLCTSDVLQYPGLVRRALRRGAHVHVGSRYIGDEVVELLGADPERVHVVPLGVSQVAGGDAAAGALLAGGDRYVLALGTVEPRKDLPGLVAAFDAVAADDPDLRLVLAGPDGWGAEALAEAVDAAAARARITRLGWVDDTARADLLAGATAFAYPSLYEGFGLPPLEAMQAGTPVVTTTAGSLPEVVGAPAVHVAPHDIDALAAAITTLTTEDGPTRAARIAAGRAHAARFSWDATAAGLVEVYRGLC